MEGILHSEACSTATKVKKCHDCLKVYNKEVKRKERARKKESTVKTRLTTRKNTSKYCAILCDKCKHEKKKSTAKIV